MTDFWKMPFKLDNFVNISPTLISLLIENKITTPDQLLTYIHQKYRLNIKKKEYKNEKEFQENLSDLLIRLDDFIH